MSQVTVILSSDITRERFCRWVKAAPRNTVASLKGVKRSIPQNARLWAMLTDVAAQAEWAGKKRTTWQWKDLFSGAVKAASNNLEVVPGLEGGFMILGLRTSEMTKAEMADLQTYIEAWGAEHGVIFTEPTTTQGPARGQPASAGVAA